MASPGTTDTRSATTNIISAIVKWHGAGGMIKVGVDFSDFSRGLLGVFVSISVVLFLSFSLSFSLSLSLAFSADE